MKKILKKNNNKNQEYISMKEKIKKILIDNAAGVNFKSKEDDYLELVVWCAMMEKKYPTDLTGEESVIFHLKIQLDAFASELSDTFALELSRNVLNHPEKVCIIELYHYIISHWNLIKSWSVTYRLLADLIEISTWEYSEMPIRKPIILF